MKQLTKRLEKIIDKLPENAIEEVVSFAEFMERVSNEKNNHVKPRKSNFFKLFGKAKSGFSDVSGNKDKHLAEIYSAKCKV